MLRHMFRLLGRPILAAFAPLSIPVLAATVPQDRSIVEIDDPLIRAEVMELGGYQELVMEFTTPTLEEVPLFTHSPMHMEFRSEGLRVRIEAQPFEHAPWVKKSHGHWKLEDLETLGWSPGGTHSRLSRSEAVLDGVVVDIPVEAWVDVFDAPLMREELPFAAVMRSRDGRRVYIHVQAGEAEDARMVTWVIEDGAYRYRVVDPVP